MRILAQHSHLNGYEHLLIHGPHVWRDITDSIDAVDTDAWRSEALLDQIMNARPLPEISVLNARFASEFWRRGWREPQALHKAPSGIQSTAKISGASAIEERRERVVDGESFVSQEDWTGFMKDRTAVEIHLGKRSFGDPGIYMKHLALYVGNVIDVGVEILPMKEMSSQMSSGISYYEGELYNVIRQGRGVPAVPLVILGIAP